MAKEEEKKPVSEAAPAARNVGVQLVPSGQSDQPVLANFTVLQPSSQLARSGKKVPERLNGRLGARVALPYDALANLHRQIGHVLQAVSKERK